MVYHGPTGDEIVTNGTQVRGYDPRTGALLWHLGPNSEIAVGSPVVTPDLIYVTAGYPPIKPIYAIRPGSRGDLALPEGSEKSEALAWSKGRGGRYRAHEAEAAERARLWKLATDYYPGFARYQERATERRIPVVVCSPVEG